MTNINSEEAVFPETRYVGSKRKIIPFILEHLEKLHFSNALDAFSGSGIVGYNLKKMGVQVFANDFLSFCYHTSRATIENNTTLISEDEIKQLLCTSSSAPTFVRDKFTGLYFDEYDCEFLDNLWLNVQAQIKSPLKKSMVLAAISRACIKKRPRGLFTFVGNKGIDNRLDLKLTLREHFILACEAFNKSIFSNKEKNKAFNKDIFELSNPKVDLVYIDTPYVSPYSDSDYSRRYHFVEAYCKYWNGLEILEHTKTRKIRSYQTAFSRVANAEDSFLRLFDKFKKSTLVVSYSSNSVPNKQDMVRLLKGYKRHVKVHEIPHRYHHGTHNHKVSENKNQVMEYLFIAQ